MKYNEEAFELSVKAYDKTKAFEELTKEGEKKQNEILKMLLRRFKKELEKNPNENNGRVTITIMGPDRHDDDYDTFGEYEFSNDITFLASDYCIYVHSEDLPTSNLDTSELTCYWITWDYKTYLEGLQNDISLTREIKRKQCKIIGHNYGKWQEKEYTKSVKVEDSGIESLHTGVGTVDIKYTGWYRKCNNCGCVQNVTNKPLEFEIEEKEKELAVLKRKLEKEKR